MENTSSDRDEPALMHPTDAEIASGRGSRSYAPTLTKDFVTERHRAYSSFPLRDSSVIDHPIFGWLRRDDALLLYEMAFFTPGNILEFGTHRGLSSSVMSEALTDAGKDYIIHTLEINREYLSDAKQSHLKAGLTNIRYHTGDAAKKVKRFLKKNKKFGFVFVDHSHRYDPTRIVCESLSDLMIDGGFAVFHDYVDRRNFDEDDHEYNVVKAIRDALPSHFIFRRISGCCALFQCQGDRLNAKRTARPGYPPTPGELV
ncbi:MAG: hypothetical protein GY807_14740 [Gammaproteobacteria bacterium]|nr:hypothetical protein [Gammaproteobacteria bacterium]